MKKIKLIFISTLMLILILGLNTTVLGAKSWNINEFTEFIKIMGYDVDGMDFSSISGYLSNTNSYLKIFRYEIDEATATSKDKLLISFSNSVPYFNNGTASFSMYTGGTRYILDFTNKTITSNNGNTITFFEAILSNTNLTSEEFLSLTYQKELIKKYCIFSELSIKSNYNTGSQTIFIPQGGKITSSSYENTTYNGTISYIPSSRTVEWNLTGGFVNGQEYALFLNEWTTSNDYDYGLRDYNDGYIVFNNINTLTGSRTISNFNFETRANQVYQFCIGLKSGDSNEYIELIKTDWLIPNDNTLFLYPNFTRSHYFQLLNLVAYNPDTELPPDTGGDNDNNTSGDTGNNNIDIAGGLNDFWGNKDNIKEEDFENQIKNEIKNIMDTMSGELSQNQIFSELQSVENGFLNFFDKNQDEKFYDLAFEWDNIELYNTTLIPEGKINISQMCRDIEVLGYIQTLTRTLFCFGTCVLIIKQIYNLILSTLGIDNPYLYEDPNTEHISYAYDVNTSTGQIRETTFYKKGNRTYRYHK